MAKRQPTPRDSDSSEQWMAERDAQVAARSRDLARGSTAWAASTRTSQPARARTPQEVAALGARQAPLKLAAMSSRQVEWSKFQREHPQLSAGLSGAADSIPFDLADQVNAYRDALDQGGLNRVFQRHDANLAFERAQDRYDQTHYALARTTGQIAGTAAQLALLAPVQGAVVGSRISQATGLMGREVAILGGVGATNGILDQAVADGLQRHRGSVGDYAGAAAGGIVNAGLLATRAGPAYSGATTGAVTSVAQDVLNGRPIAWDRASQSAIASGAVGGLAGRPATRYVDKYPSFTPGNPQRAKGQLPINKGQLGELASEVRSYLRFDPPVYGPKRRVEVPGMNGIFPDHLTRSGRRVEAKLGEKARLSKGQTVAVDKDILHRVDHFLPRDFGAAAGVLANGFGYQIDRWMGRK